MSQANLSEPAGHAEQALKAYLQLLTNKGADAANLAQRRDFIQKLIPLLEENSEAGLNYREQVDSLLHGCEKSQWPFYINVAREYFHFWTDDIKAIAAMHASGGFEIAPALAAVPTETLKQLWKNLDSEKFGVAELWPLKAYTAALREEGAEQGVVDTRAKLVKLLLVRLREVEEKNGANYRAAVDSTLPLFVMKETRYFFLIVVREFYYFWINDPDAASHLTLETTPQ